MNKTKLTICLTAADTWDFNYESDDENIIIIIFPDRSSTIECYVNIQFKILISKIQKRGFSFYKSHKQSSFTNEFIISKESYFLFNCLQNNGKHIFEIEI